MWSRVRAVSGPSSSNRASYGPAWMDARRNQETAGPLGREQPGAMGLLGVPRRHCPAQHAKAGERTAKQPDGGWNRHDPRADRRLESFS